MDMMIRINQHEQGLHLPVLPPYRSNKTVSSMIENSWMSQLMKSVRDFSRQISWKILKKQLVTTNQEILTCHLRRSMKEKTNIVSRKQKLIFSENFK